MPKYAEEILAAVTGLQRHPTAEQVFMEVMCLRLRRIAKMAGVEENDIDRLLVNPPEKVEIEVKYKIKKTIEKFNR